MPSFIDACKNVFPALQDMVNNGMIEPTEEARQKVAALHALVDESLATIDRKAAERLNPANAVPPADANEPPAEVVNNDGNAWVKETPDEEPGVRYQYAVTMAPIEPADTPARRQVIMNRKEFINFKEGLAGRRGLFDDRGKYTENGSMPLSRALAVLDKASDFDVCMIAFAVQGMDWANRSTLKPPEEFLWDILTAYWNGRLTPMV